MNIKEEFIKAYLDIYDVEESSYAVVESVRLKLQQNHGIDVTEQEVENIIKGLKV